MAKILLVDDIDALRDLHAMLLGRRGHEVLHARDGREAVNLASSWRPDVILMDLEMPVLDGLSATRILKADPALADIPVIAFTSNSLPTDRERALEAGCDDHDTKPLDIERLTSKINRLLPMG